MNFSSRTFKAFAVMALLALVPVGMSLGRLPLVDTQSYVYMNWNLFLGLLPLLFAWLLKKSNKRFFVILFGLLWLGFLPNAPYMVTDFIHMADVGPRATLWYDGLMLFGFAGIGMLSWLVSTYWVYRRFAFASFIPIITLATAFGMYLGRYIRFNTWDAITQPEEILSVVWDTLIHPLSHEPFLLFTTVFWVFLLVSYFGFAQFMALITGNTKSNK